MLLPRLYEARREAPTGILSNKMNGAPSRTSHWCGAAPGVYGSHSWSESVVGTGDMGMGRVLGRGRGCHPRARGVEAAGNEGHAPLERKGTW